MPTTLSQSAAQDALRRLGWGNAPYPRAVAGFQHGFALLGTALAVDGIVGPQTSAAITLSMAHLDAGTPTASKYFSFSEFACKCSGACPGEANLPRGAAPSSRIWVRRGLLLALDRLRAAHYPSGLTPVSGCRCWPYHAALYKKRGQEVTTQSAHLYGGAADIPANVPLNAVKGMKVFSGLGYQSKTKGHLVSHVDVRHLVGDMLHRNPKMKTPSIPATWPY